MQVIPQDPQAAFNDSKIAEARFSLSFYIIIIIIMVTHQSYSHQVGICHNDEGWEYDTVKFPLYPNS